MTSTGIVAIEIPFVDDIVGGVAKDAASAVLDAVVGFVFGLVIGAIEAITNGLISVMETTSTLNLTGAEFAGLSEIRAQVLGMSLFLVLGFLFLNVLRSVSRGEPGGVIRAVLVDLPTALLYTALFTSVANVLIVIVDQASAAVVGDLGESVGQVGAVLVAGNTVATAATGGVAAPVGGLLALFFGLLYIFAAMVVWAELLIRSALIYIILVTAPLGFAARASAGARQIARRTAEVMFGIIVSKLGIALAFGVGASLIDTGNSFGEADGGVVPVEDLSAMFVGVTVVLLAAFMPWMILKMIPVMESATGMGGAERAPLRAAGAGIGLALGAVGAAKLAGAGTGSGRSGGGGSSAGGASGSSAAGPSGPEPSGGLTSSTAPPDSSSRAGGCGGSAGQRGSSSASSSTADGSGSATGGSDALTGTGSGSDDGGGVTVVQVAAQPGIVAVSAPRRSGPNGGGGSGGAPLGSQSPADTGGES